jgi:phenylalanyl-tRNA synthetase alpha chain
MKTLHEQIAALQSEFNNALATATTQQELEAVRIAFLGRNGRITELMHIIKTLSLEEKRVMGPVLNAFKVNAETAYNAKALELAHAEAQLAEQRTQFFDVTAYKPQPAPGTLHVYTRVIEQLEDIFISMGFTVVDGPEIETEYHNFTALNIPADHPAREMHDTFWLDVPGMLLRTHTSPAQVRVMESQELPLAVFAPGRTYRNEATDASHDFMFTQGEVLFIDKNVSLSNLLATAQTFLQAFFEKKDLTIRARPGYFPFVEPGVEIDGSCPFCSTGCSVCKHTTWIELMGSGLVHPNVLRCSGIDPEIYSGFAIGFGIERLAMIKYGIDDIRLFHSAKINFLDQF